MMYSGKRSSKQGLQAGEVEMLDGINGVSATDLQIGGQHYKDMEIQPSAFITRNNLGWCEGNAVKYICRHHIKGGAQDIDKAIHYLQLLKEIEYAEETAS